MNAFQCFDRSIMLKLIVMCFSLLVFSTSFSIGAKLWSPSGDSSVTAVQGESATLTWVVTLNGSDTNKVWSYVKVAQFVGSTGTDLVTFQKSGEKTISDSNPIYQSRASDLTFNITQTGSVVTINFTMANLNRATDEKGYKAFLGFTTDFSFYPYVTFLNIQVPPEITTPDHNVTVNESSTAQLVCNANGNPTPNITWTKNGVKVGTGSPYTTPDVTRYNNSQCYTCQASNGIGQDKSAKVCLNVQYSPIIKTTNYNITVNESSTAQLVCNANGNPTPTITWTKNGVKVGTGSPYTTPVVTRYNNSQCYTCQASNGIGIDKSAEVCLNVQYSPVIKTRNYDVTVNESSTAQLVCNANGNPTPNITWTKNGVIVGTGSPYTTPVVTRHNHSQCYTCQASNVMGQDKGAKVCLNVQYPPIIKTANYNVTVNESSTAQLVCNANGNPEPNITWTKNGVKVGTGSPFTTPVVTRYNNSQCYTCQPSNVLGQDKSARVCLNVQYGPFDLTIIPNVTEIEEGRTLNLKCSADGNPGPSYTWRHNRNTVSSSAQLLVPFVSKDESGNYTCIATNLLNSASSLRSITVLSGINGRLRITKAWDNNLSIKTSSIFRTLESSLNEEVQKIYVNTSLRTVKLNNCVEGSVILNFILYFAEQDGSLQPLVDAVSAGKVVINGSSAINGSVELGFYVPSTTTKSPTTITGTTPPIILTSVKPTEEPKVTIIIIVVVVIVVVLVIIIIVLIICWRKNKRTKRNKRNDSILIKEECILERTAAVNIGVNDQDLSKYAAHGPSHINKAFDWVDGQRDNKNNNSNQPESSKAKEEPTYAAVDTRKKHSKKKPGDVVYADLKEFQENGTQPNDSRGDIALEHLPKDKNIKMPDVYEETTYAEIVGTKKMGDKKEDPESNTSTNANALNDSYTANDEKEKSRGEKQNSGTQSPDSNKQDLPMPDSTKPGSTKPDSTKSDSSEPGKDLSGKEKDKAANPTDNQTAQPPAKEDSACKVLMHANPK